VIHHIPSQYIKSTFNIDIPKEIDKVIDLLPPSLLEYHLDTLFSFGDESYTFNRSNIEQSIDVDTFKIFFDYEEECYMEKLNSYDEDTFPSLF